jgi:glycosyltransferase involved in cell wall biosynthesis
MKIGFDVSQTGQLKAGCGYFAESLIRHLAAMDSVNEYILYPTFGDFYFDPEWAETTFLPPQDNFQRAAGHKSHEEAQIFWRRPLEPLPGNPDLIHSNNFFCPGDLKKTRLVYTLYDLSFVSHPEWTTEANRIGCFNGVFNASLYADQIISISEYSRQHFLETFPHYPADRITVIPLASRFSGRTGIARSQKLSNLQPQSFWLNVGTIEPRKNQLRLLQAYARLKSSQERAFPLVIAGGKGWLMNSFEREIKDLGLEQNVIVTDYVSNEDLQWLYENCFAFVYPSLFEGFGLPVLEAMSLEAPVISSNTTSIPEVAGSAGILVDPLQEKAIFQAMMNLSEGTVNRDSLRQKSLEQSQKFSWASSARKTLAVYHEAISLKSRPAGELL